MALRGKKLSRLLRWAGYRNEALPATAEAGDFALQAKVVAAPEQFLLNEARGEALGTAFTGSLKYLTGSASRVRLAA